MKYKITKRSKIILEILILLSASFCVINWFGGDYFIKTLDSLFGFNHTITEYYSLSMWKDVSAFGIGVANPNTVFLHIFLSITMNFFGLISGEKITFFLLVFFSMFSFWLFLYFVFSKKIKFSHSVARVISAIFYSFNPFSLSFFWWHHMLLIIFWIAVPIVILLLYKILTKNNPSFFYYFLLAASFLIFAPGMNPLTLFALSIILIIAISLFNLFKIVSFKSTIKRIVLSALTTLIVNLWYILPLFITAKKAYYISTTAANAEHIFLWTSKYSVMLNTIRLQGNKLIYLKYVNDYYYNWGPYFTQNPFFIVLTFIFPILALSSLLFVNRLKKKERKILVVFTFLLIIGIFLQKQAAEPFGWVTAQMLKLPFGDAFRNAYDKFAIITVFSYSVLLFFFTRSFIKVLRKKVGKRMVYALIVVLLLFGMYTYPFWTGDVAYSGGEYVPSHRVIIPEDYYEFGRFMDRLNYNKTFVRIAVLPTTWRGEAAYKWEKGIQPNSDPLLQYFLKPKYSIIQFARSNSYGNRIMETLKNSLEPYNENMSKFVKILADFGTEYIVFHKDWDDNFIRSLPNTEYYESLISSYSYLSTLNGENYWSFDGNNSYITIKNVENLDQKGFDLELLFIPELQHLKMGSSKEAIQNIVKVGESFCIKFVEKKTDKGNSTYIYMDFSTIEGYRWTSTIGVDYVRNLSTPPLKLYVHYDTIANKIFVKVNDVLYNVKVYQTGGVEGNIAPLDLKKNTIKICSKGLKGVEGFREGVFYLYLNSGGINLTVSPTTPYPSENIEIENVYVSRFWSDNVQIEKIFENEKLMVFHIHNSTPIITKINASSTHIKDFVRINPSLWKVKVNATKSFMLSFAEAYDPLWEVRIYKDGKKLDVVNPIPLYSAINGFWINETGNLTVEIRYTLQDWFEISFLISIATLLSCTGYLLYDWKKDDERIKMIKSKIYTILKKKK